MRAVSHRVLSLVWSVHLFPSIVVRPTASFVVRPSSSLSGFAPTVDLSRNAMTDDKARGSWLPSSDLRDSDPDEVAAAGLAKDAAYAASVLEAWRADVSTSSSSVGRPLVYRVDDDDDALHGHVVVPSSSSSLSSSSAATRSGRGRVPTVVFFHTGAGPRDCFLRWRADALASSLGCAVLIADLLSDGDGWAWDADRTRYARVRESLSRNDRALLRRRVAAALTALDDAEDVPNDPDATAVVGWCLGGQAVSEILAAFTTPRNDEPWSRVRAMATFHGVFDGVRERTATTTSTTTTEGESSVSASSSSSSSSPPRVLVCHGTEDPFVSREDLTHLCDRVLRKGGHDFSLLEYPGRRHGFSNPAQIHNPDPRFAYDRDADERSWAAVRDALRETFAENS